jgi:ribosomal protein S18 acetylase RimI-like enzyme
MPNPAPRPARPDELAQAFTLLFSHLAPGDRSYRAARAVELAERGDLDARGVFVLPGAAGLAGVGVCQPVPGAGALLWPPVVILQPRIALEDALVGHACAWLRQQGARLAQCLLADEEAPLAAALLRNGFDHITGLSYLQHDLQLHPALLGTPVRLSFECYDPARPDEFQEALAGSYEQTLDCPEVNGVRTVEEVLQGHWAQGRHDPARWWLARSAGAAVGVLLVVEPSPGEWEVAYMGLRPRARRQGLGRELLLHAVCEARAAGAYRLILSVDDRNTPARRLYERIGFQPYDHRLVLLTIWR